MICSGSPRLRRSRRAAPALKKIPSGRRRSRTPPAMSPISAGCRAAALNGSRPSTLRVSRCAGSATSSSSTGLARRTSGSRASVMKSSSAKPSRGPLTTRSGSPTSRFAAALNSPSATALIKCTAAPSATPSAIASTVTDSRIGCSRHCDSIRRRQMVREAPACAPRFKRSIPRASIPGRREPGCGRRCRRRCANG